MRGLNEDVLWHGFMLSWSRLVWILVLTHARNINWKQLRTLSRSSLHVFWVALGGLFSWETRHDWRAAELEGGVDTGDNIVLTTQPTRPIIQFIQIIHNHRDSL